MGKRVTLYKVIDGETFEAVDVKSKIENPKKYTLAGNIPRSEETKKVWESKKAKDALIDFLVGEEFIIEERYNKEPWGQRLVDVRKQSGKDVNAEMKKFVESIIAEDNQE